MLLQQKTEVRQEYDYRDWIRRYYPLLATAVLYALVATLSYAIVGNKAPRPFSPLNTIVDWASWFDVLIAFPILSILCAIPFVGKRSSYVVVPVILLSPLFLILNSFFLTYNLPALGLLFFITPIIDIVPAALIAFTYAVPVVLALLVLYGISREPVKVWHMPKFYFVAVASVSVALVAADFFMRYAVFSSSMITVVSDVGWAAQSGAMALIHGISPYSASLPPWGGPAPLSYGPMEFVLIAPFAPLPIDVGAHVASLFYAFLTALGIYMTIREIRPSVAPMAALTFIALPITFYAVSAAFTPHLIIAALIAWTTYFYVTQKYRLAGLLMGLSGLTIGIPFALIIPFIFPLNRSQKFRMLQGYLPIVAILPLGMLFIFGGGFLNSTSVFTGVVSLYGLGLFLTPFADGIMKWIPVAAIAVWFLYASSKGRTREDAIRTGAIFMLLLPFAVGFFFAFFFVWQGLLLLIYIFSRMEVSNTWTRQNGVD